MKTTTILVASVATLVITVCNPCEAKTIKFSGYDWIVRSGTNEGPGPNNWDENNVWVDKNGYLHLKLTKRQNQWYSSEVYTKDRLGFGRYQFQVIGRLDKLDPNTVFGLYNYPTPDVGVDGTNEIDIEFAKWGNVAASIGNYTVWPVKKELDRKYNNFPVNLNGSYTTHRFTWTAANVYFQSLNGHYDDNTNQFANWLYQPLDSANYIGHKPMPVYINLWLFKGQPPTNGQQVELIIRSFKFIPM
ncbi:MAG: glycoside hydrolase family 16 protein [Nostoc sp.]